MLHYKMAPVLRPKFRDRQNFRSLIISRDQILETEKKWSEGATEFETKPKVGLKVRRHFATKLGWSLHLETSPNFRSQIETKRKCGLKI